MMKQYKMEIEHFGSCPECFRGFSLHQKYEADTGHVYGLIEMCCPADASLIILDLEKVNIERIAEATHEHIQITEKDLFGELGFPTIEISTHEKEPKKSRAKVTQLIPKKDDAERLLNQKEVAKILDVSPRTLEKWRTKGCGPLFVKLSRRCVRYRSVDVAQFALTYKNSRGKK